MGPKKSSQPTTVDTLDDFIRLLETCLEGSEAKNLSNNSEENITKQNQTRKQIQNYFDIIQEINLADFFINETLILAKKI